MTDANLELRIARLDLKPGDVLVAKVGMPMTGDVAAKIRKQFESRLPAGVRVLVLDRSIDLEILSAEEINRRTTPSEAK